MTVQPLYTVSASSLHRRLLNILLLCNLHTCDSTCVVLVRMVWARRQHSPSNSKWINWKLFPNVAWQPNLPGPQKERGKDLRLCFLNCSHCLLSEERQPSHTHIIMKCTYTLTQTRSQKHSPSKRENWLLFMFQVNVATIIIIKMQEATTRHWIQWEKRCAKNLATSNLVVVYLCSVFLSLHLHTSN